MANLAIGSLASLSVPDVTISVDEFFATTKDLQMFNYPNPFNNKTTISYYLHEDTHVTLTVMNSLGQKVAVLEDSYQREGIHEINFKRNDLPGGIYFIVANTLSGSTTSKMIIEL